MNPPYERGVLLERGHGAFIVPSSDHEKTGGSRAGHSGWTYFSWEEETGQ